MPTEDEGGHGRGAMALTGLEGKVAVVTGAGRMRSIGRPTRWSSPGPAVTS